MKKSLALSLFFFLLIVIFPVKISYAQCPGNTVPCFTCDAVQGCLIDPTGSYTAAQCGNICTGSGSFTGAINWAQLYASLRQIGGGFIFAPNLTIGAIISAALKYIFPLAGILLLVYLIWGGFIYLTSAGNPQQTKAAQGIITNALIGFVVIFVAYWIVQAIGVILGLTRIQSIF